jgi:hypothetical protein
MTDVDTTAADMLEELDNELEAAGIHLVFAEMKDAVRGKIRDYGLDWLAEREAFYPTIGSAVKAYRVMAGIPKADKAPGAHRRDDGDGDGDEQHEEHAEHGDGASGDAPRRPS